MALGVKENDEVITTSFSFATAEVISLLKAKPVFVDIEPDTYNIDPNKIEEKINPKTKAIVAVSLYGQPLILKKSMQLLTNFPFQSLKMQLKVSVLSKTALKAVI